MKTINLLGDDIIIKDEFDIAVCVYETSIDNLDDYSTLTIKFGQKIYNIKILQSGSIIFTISPQSKSYYITMFPQMFGFPDKDQIAEIKQLNDSINNSNNRILEIFDKIKRTGYSDIPG